MVLLQHLCKESDAIWGGGGGGGGGGGRGSIEDCNHYVLKYLNFVADDPCHIWKHTTLSDVHVW